MKTITLTEALTRIPPLPYKVLADPGHRGQHPFHDQRFLATADTEWEYDYEHGPSGQNIESGSLVAAMRDVPIGTTAYLAHAANHLPACVAALRALTDWGRTHTSPLDANSPHALLIQATEALAAAENIPA